MTGAALSNVNRPPAEEPGPVVSKKRSLIWFVLLFSIAGVVGYAVWRVGRPIAAARAATDATARTGAGGARGRNAGGLVPVVVTPASRADIPVYLNGLGNATIDVPSNGEPGSLWSRCYVLRSRASAVGALRG